MTQTTMPTPIAADLLIDPPHGDRDERFDGVHLLEVDADGEAKVTAERIEGGWKIAEWELTEDLDGVLGGTRYWFCRSWHTLPDAQLQALSALAATIEQPVAPAAEASPAEVKAGHDEHEIPAGVELWCWTCTEPGKARPDLQLPREFVGPCTVPAPKGVATCPGCGGQLHDAPF